MMKRWVRRPYQRLCTNNIPVTTARTMMMNQTRTQTHCQSFCSSDNINDRREGGAVVLQRLDRVVVGDAVSDTIETANIEPGVSRR
jgi:hypothetical protein